MPLRWKNLKMRICENAGFECVYIRESPPDAATQGTRNESDSPGVINGNKKGARGSFRVRH
jgi:hypothetical protein